MSRGNAMDEVPQDDPVWVFPYLGTIVGGVLGLGWVLWRLTAVTREAGLSVAIEQVLSWPSLVVPCVLMGALTALGALVVELVGRRRVSANGREGSRPEAD